MGKITTGIATPRAARHFTLLFHIRFSFDVFDAISIERHAAAFDTLRFSRHFSCLIIFATPPFCRLMLFRFEFFASLMFSLSLHAATPLLLMFRHFAMLMLIVSRFDYLMLGNVILIYFFFRYFIAITPPPDAIADAFLRFSFSAMFRLLICRSIILMTLYHFFLLHFFIAFIGFQIMLCISFIFRHADDCCQLWACCRFICRLLMLYEMIFFSLYFIYFASLMRCFRCCRCHAYFLSIFFALRLPRRFSFERLIFTLMPPYIVTRVYTSMTRDQR